MTGNKFVWIFIFLIVVALVCLGFILRYIFSQPGVLGAYITRKEIDVGTRDFADYTIAAFSLEKQRAVQVIVVAKSLETRDLVFEFVPPEGPRIRLMGNDGKPWSAGSAYANPVYTLEPGTYRVALTGHHSKGLAACYVRFRD